MAAVVTTVVTVILLGVLIPIFESTQAKSTRSATSLDVRVATYRRRDRIRNRAALQRKLERSRT